MNMPNKSMYNVQCIKGKQRILFEMINFLVETTFRKYVDYVNHVVTFYHLYFVDTGF